MQRVRQGNLHTVVARLRPQLRRPVVYIPILLVVAIILLQLFYPRTIALPLSQVNSSSVGMMNQEALSAHLADTKDQPVKLAIGKETISAKARDVGIRADSQATLDKLSQYPWYWRLVPLSSLVLGAQRNLPIETSIDQTVLVKYSQKIANLCNTPAHNATLKVESDTVRLDPARDGTSCPPESLARQLDQQTIKENGLRYTVRLDAVKPARSDKDVAAQLNEAREIIARPLRVEVANKTYDVPPEMLASWLVFAEQPVASLNIETSAEQMKKYFDTIQKDIYIKPGTTVVTTRDGIEVSRVSGAPGRGIDAAKSAEAIDTAIKQKASGAILAVSALPPSLSFNRSYSNTPEGLSALVGDLSRDNNNMAISVRKLGDRGVHANGDQQYHPASTYKLFVAYSVLKRVDGGQWTMDMQTAHGSVGACLDTMIINSDNACAEWFGSKIGWSTVFSEVRAHGLSRTAVTGSGFVSTTNDLALFLQKLEANQLGLSEPSRARLIDSMKRQVFRKGIPAGVNGAVADKVGFLDDMLHDAAIVYSPRGVYVVTIMSKGSSWEAIANVSRAIDKKLSE